MARGHNRKRVRKGVEAGGRDACGTVGLCRLGSGRRLDRDAELQGGQVMGGRGRGEEVRQRWWEGEEETGRGKKAV